MPKTFRQDDVFPLIHRLITDRTHKDSAFIGHADLVDALLESVDGQAVVATAAQSSKLDTRGTASNMVAWFSQRYTTGENQFGELLDRQKIGGRWAYRYRHTSPTVAYGSVGLPPDVEMSEIEGNPKFVTHLKRERSPKLVKAKLAEVEKMHGRVICECCGFDAKLVFPGLTSFIVEVHHRIPLSDCDTIIETKLGDLSVLCPTCHRAIHRSNDLAVEAFKLKYFPNN